MSKRDIYKSNRYTYEDLLEIIKMLRERTAVRGTGCRRMRA